MSARTLIFTGEGKGKTTAAFGMVLRAAGHNQRVLVVQFLKSNAATGELVACAHLPQVEAVQMGCGFVPAPEHPAFAAHQQKAREALEFARQAVISSKHDLIVLDEPYTGLDVEGKPAVQEYVRERVKGRTTLLITHDSDEAAWLGAREVRMP